jgi:hypothetical protein
MEYSRHSQIVCIHWVWEISGSIAPMARCKGENVCFGYAKNISDFVCRQVAPKPATDRTSGNVEMIRNIGNRVKAAQLLLLLITFPLSHVSPQMKRKRS